MNGNTNGNKRDWSKLIGVAVLLLGFAAQWGATSTKLEQMDRRLDELLLEVRTQRLESHQLAQRVAAIEGRISREQG